MQKNNIRTTIYIDKELKRKFDVYKLYAPDDETCNLSGMLSKLLREYLDNPFNWADKSAYELAQKEV